MVELPQKGRNPKGKRRRLKNRDAAPTRIAKASPCPSYFRYEGIYLHGFITAVTDLTGS